MRHQILPKYSAISLVRNEFHSGSSPNTSQIILKRNSGTVELVSKLLDRRWALSRPDAKINQITILDRKGDGLNGGVSFSNNTQPCLGEDMVNKKQHFPSFYVLRDDLLHPLVNGNKARKLDALLPLLEDHAVTDVVTCGGCQSAHAAAVAVSCAERGMKSHLLFRGEEPEILTGYNLISRLYGDVHYIPRSTYARREEMLVRHAESLVERDGSILWLSDILESSSEKHFPQLDSIIRRVEKSRKVVIINEGAGDAIALIGVMRLITYLSEDHLFGKKQALKIVVDAGTGTTAVGLALGASFSGLPWEVTGVMLADKIEGYRKKEQNLISEFLKSSICHDAVLFPGDVNAGIVNWIDRSFPRKFGNILEGEVEECQKIAQQTGILVDPIYTLAGWDIATRLVQKAGEEEDAKVVMLHTGGTLGMFGLAQRYKSYFQMPKDNIR